MKTSRFGDEIELHVERLNSDGQGVGTHGGLVTFVDLALPGELVRAEILEIKKTYQRARLISIEQESPERAKPDCSHYIECGGCQTMHLSYPAQLKQKRIRVQEAMRRIGGIENPKVEECLASAAPLHYRNKLQFHFRKEGLGFFSQRSHFLVPIEHCWVHGQLGQKVFTELRKALDHHGIQPYDDRTGRGLLRNVLIRSSERSNECVLAFVANEDAPQKFKPISDTLARMFPETLVGIVLNVNTRKGNTILGEKNHILHGRDHLTERFLSLELQVSVTSFFQVNTIQAEQLFLRAIEIAELKGGEHALDAYCGTGVVALAIAGRVTKVIGVESNAASIANARENARRNCIANVEFTVADATEFLCSEKNRNVDVVFLDPPRKGCDPLFLEALASSDATKLIYISCDPSTMARDIAILIRLGFQLISLSPVDLFPQTAHVECIARLDRLKP
jgi:23S rRNA (uracil1939-C5)-methyltransferase